MNDGSRVAFCSVLGAVVGGIVGYLYLTESGGRLRQQIEPRIDDFVNEVRRLRNTVEKAKSAADESFRSLSEVLGEEGKNWQGERVSH